MYSIEDSPLCLTGTAEVPLAGLHMDAILPASALPLRLAAFGRAFRTEAGAAGSASRGLYRLHQFSKASTTPAVHPPPVYLPNHTTPAHDSGLTKGRLVFCECQCAGEILEPLSASTHLQSDLGAA